MENNYFTVYATVKEIDTYATRETFIRGDIYFTDSTIKLLLEAAEVFWKISKTDDELCGLATYNRLKSLLENNGRICFTRKELDVMSLWTSLMGHSTKTDNEIQFVFELGKSLFDLCYKDLTSN